MSAQQQHSSPVLDERGGRPPGDRVVVVGSGFAGYVASRRLGRLLRGTGVEVVLVSDSDGMLYSPLLPDVAAGTVDPRAITVPTATGLPGVRVVRGHVGDVDLDGRSLTYADVDGTEHTLGWTRLLLTPGSITRLLDIPGLAEHSVGLKTVGEALFLRDRLITRLELADVTDDADRRRAALTFLVVGAGYAGTELCAQLARLTHQLLPRYPGVHPDEVHWLLVDVADAVMPELGEELGADALALLRRRGVDVRLGTSLERVGTDEVRLTDGTVLGCRTVVWCAGVTANPLIGDLGLPTDHGRLVVDTHLQVPGHPEVYSVGDAAAVPDLTKDPDDDGHLPLCPPTAQHAVRQAHAVARNVAASVGHGTARRYRHHDLGLVVDLGGPDAAAVPLGVRLRGRLAKLVTRGYHLYALPSARRRCRVLTDWALEGAGPPDSVAFGLVPPRAALVRTAEPDERPAFPSPSLPGAGPG